MSRRSVRIHGGEDNQGNAAPPDTAHVSGGSLHVAYGDSPNVDAFSRLRVSNPVTLMDSVLKYDKQANIWYEKLTGTGTSVHSFDQASVLMSVNKADDEVIRQTREYFRYQPGKSHLILMTFVMEAAAYGDSVTGRVGYFDAENGIFLQKGIDGIQLVRRSSATGTVVDTGVPQSDWNLNTYDAMDLTKAQVMVIDLQWLGVGRVRIGFMIGDEIVYVHEFTHSNTTTGVYMTTAQLPVRFEISTPELAGGSLRHICSCVISEGGYEIADGIPHSVNSGAPAGVSGTLVPIMSIRPKATFAGEVNRVVIVQRHLQIINSGNGVAEVHVIFDGTLTGAAFAGVEADSTTEFDTAATVITGGHRVQTFYVPSSNQASAAVEQDITGGLSLTVDIDGANPTPLTVAITNHGTVTAAAAMTWQEYL